MEIKARTLGIALGNQSGLVAIKGAISIGVEAKTSYHQPRGDSCR
jgi:hypothetical protein